MIARHYRVHKKWPEKLPKDLYHCVLVVFCLRWNLAPCQVNPVVQRDIDSQVNMGAIVRVKNEKDRKSAGGMTGAMNCVSEENDYMQLLGCQMNI